MFNVHLLFIIFYSNNIHSSPVLQVFCSIEFIRLKITLDYNYFGIIYTLPNRETCSTIGSGDTELAFFIPLKEPGRSQCGVLTRNKIHSVALVIRHHHVVETSKDYTFLVQCLESIVVQQGELGESNVVLNLFEGEQVLSNAVVGHRYRLEIALPKQNYEISSCVAFDGGGVDLRYHNLLNDNGCPLDETILTPFRHGHKKLTFLADLTMFRFNGSHEFNIQCAIIKCQGRCVDRNCVKDSKTMDDLLYDATLEKSQNFKSVSSLATTRLQVRDHSKTNEIKRYVGCHYSEQPDLMGLSFLLALLVSLTVILTVTAFHNRPFRCHWHQRDSPIMEDIAKLDETNPTQLSKYYFTRSIESSSGSKTFCERNRETTVVKEIVTATIATPENPSHSRMASPLSSKSSRSTLKSVKNRKALCRRESTLKSLSRLSQVRKIQLRQNVKLPRNKSFVSAVIEKKLNDVDQKETHMNEKINLTCNVSSSISPRDSNVSEVNNVYETPSNKKQIVLENSQLGLKSCRNNSPVYINVDSSSQSLICPIEIARKKRLRNKLSDTSKPKKWRI